MIIPFPLNEGARPFKWFHIQPNCDPLDVDALTNTNAFTLEVESERPECLEVELIPRLARIDPNAPTGKFIPIAGGGPFRVTARLIGAAGDVVAVGAMLAYVIDPDDPNLPPGDLQLAMGPPEKPGGEAPSRLIVES